MGPSRRHRLPQAVRVSLGRDERVLVAAPLVGGGWAVATPRLVAVADAAAILWRRPWHDVDHGAWDDDASSITITWVDGTRTELALADNARTFPTAFRERVQSSIVHVERLELGGVTVRAVIRRAGDGTLFSQVIADSDVTMSEPLMREVVALEARARRAVGLPG